jgi:glycosyltransferase involved in cell wall biosynthesis
VHGLAAATAALGHDVHVYTTNIDGADISNVPVGVPVERDGVSITYFPAGLGRRVFRSPEMDRTLERTIGSFDIVHIHYVWVWPTVAAAAAARRHGVPYVLSPRGMLVADLIRRRRALPKLAWLALFDRKTISSAAAIHATTESEANDIRALGLATPRIEIIANGVELPPISDTGRNRTDTRAASGNPYILFLGRVSWKKGLDRLVEGMTLVRGADLVIAGYDENGYQSDVERRVAKLGIAERVHFIGPVEGESKWEWIRNSICLVLPSYNENFGMSVIEAMAVGRPVVVSAKVGIADDVAETGSGVVADGDPASLAEAINAVLGDPEGRQRMGEAGRKTVHERFGWTRIARRMEDLYRECIATSLECMGAKPEP